MKKRFLNSSINLIKKYKNFSKDELDIICYGLEGVYLTITKALIIFSFALVLEIVKEVILLLISYNIIRSQAFGLHASKSIYCLISSLVIFIGGAYICKYIVFPFWMMIVISIICNICLFIYAPADTHKRPIVNIKKRKRFKLFSSSLGMIYTLFIILFYNNLIANYLFIGMIISVIVILPITYKIFNLPYDNYKRYNYGV